MAPRTSEHKDQHMSVAVKALNEAYRRDPDALRKLLGMRVPCNQNLADDPHVVVRDEDEDEDEFDDDHAYTLGTLGLLNGVLSALGYPAVAGIYEALPDGEVLTGFCDETSVELKPT